MTKVKINDYLSNPKLSACLPQSLFLELTISALKGNTHIELQNSIIIDIESEYNKLELFESYLNTVSSLNNQGIEFEKEGNLIKAILKYEKCMQVMYDYSPKHIAWHSPDRLRILYRKTESPKELQFLEIFIGFCNNNSIEIPELYNKKLNQLKIKSL